MTTTTRRTRTTTKKNENAAHQMNQTNEAEMNEESGKKNHTK